MSKTLERAVPVQHSDPALVLDGLYLGVPESARGAVVGAPHPLMGGSMHHPVVCEIAYALRELGVASLRFEWRGVGGSRGAPSGEIEDADADYAAAIAHVRECVDGPLVAAGYSWGAAAAFRAAAGEPRVQRLWLVAPPVALLDAAVLAALTGPILVIAAEHDTYAPPGDLERLLADHPNASLEVVPGADHFFTTGLPRLT